MHPPLRAPTSPTSSPWVVPVQSKKECPSQFPHAGHDKVSSSHLFVSSHPFSVLSSQVPIQRVVLVLIHGQQEILRSFWLHSQVLSTLLSPFFHADGPSPATPVLDRLPRFQRCMQTFIVVPVVQKPFWSADGISGSNWVQRLHIKGG